MWAKYVPFYLCQRMRSVRQQRFFTSSQHKKKLFKIRIHQQFASVCYAYGSNLLAYTAHTVTNHQIFCAFLAYAGHAANCQRVLRMRQPIASVCCAYGSNLLAQTAHEVAKTKWPVSHPSVKNVTFLFHPYSPLHIETS